MSPESSLFATRHQLNRPIAKKFCLPAAWHNTAVLQYCSINSSIRGRRSEDKKPKQCIINFDLLLSSGHSMDKACKLAHNLWPAQQQIPWRHSFYRSYIRLRLPEPDRGHILRRGSRRRYRIALFVPSRSARAPLRRKRTGFLQRSLSDGAGHSLLPAFRSFRCHALPSNGIKRC